MNTDTNKRGAVTALLNAIALMETKGRDYNAAVKQAEYYPRGVISIYEMMSAKMLRLKSVMHAAKTTGSAPNHESLADSALDLINYTAFMVEYLRGEMDGQDPNSDVFNVPKIEG